MTEGQHRKIYKKHLKMMPHKVREITGTALPDFPLCNNIQYFAGRSIALQDMVSLSAHNEYHQAKNTLGYLVQELDVLLDEKTQELYRINKHVSAEDITTIRQELYVELGTHMKDVYQKLLREEMKLGSIRLPSIVRRYDKTAVVKSQHGAWDINYSPTLTEIPTLGPDIIDSIADTFTKAMILNQPCTVLSIRFHCAINEREYADAYKIMSSFLVLNNQYMIREFDEKRNDVEYQHRDDDNPMLF